MFGLESNILLNNLSIFLQYRYLILAVMSLLIILTSTLSYYNKSFKNFSNRYKLPPLKEELRVILYSWNNGFMGDFCVNTINYLSKHTQVKQFSLSLYFIISYFFKAIQLYLFIKFCLYNGDFRTIIYLSPVFFIIWVTDIIYYYFYWFVEGNFNYMNDLLDKQINAFSWDNWEGYLKFQSPSDVILTLTPFGLQEGYNSSHIPILQEKWFILGNLLSTLQKHKIIVFYMQTVFLSCFIFCWFYLCYHFFLKPFLCASFWPRFPRFKMFSLLRQPYDARFLKNVKDQVALANNTNGAYSPGHPVFGEEQSDGTYRAEVQGTHGKGSSQNPSQDFPSNSMDSSNKGPQKVIPFDEPQVLPKSALTSPIPGSEAKLNTTEALMQFKKIREGSTHD